MSSLLPTASTPIIVLASSSANRLRLLKSIGIEPKVVVSDFEENLPKSLPVREFVEKTAYGKLQTVLEQFKKNPEPYDVIIACDTVIHFENEIIGKPANEEDAIKTLKRLRQNTHACYSGVAMAYADGTEDIFCSESFIDFGDYPDKIIEQYVKTGTPLSRAGSYGIQEFGGVFVKSIRGCFSNIVGLPIHEVHSRLVKKNIL